jgi:hypothetical protein
MDWSYPPSSGPDGVYEIGRRLARELGRIPDATSFINDAREMLRITRRVENVARGGRLFVGFQSAAKMELERERYNQLVADGTNIVAFGEGRLSAPIEGVDYRALNPDRRRLANNWFLVTDDPEPVGFVSWETSDPDLFGEGGAATPGKSFVGFITDDPGVVQELIGKMERWGRTTPPRPDSASAASVTNPDPASQDLIEAIRTTSAEATGAGAGAVVLALRQDDDDAALKLAVAIAREEQRPLVVVDRSAESIFGSPYNDLRGDDDYRPQPDRLFDAAVAVREGRARTARTITAASVLGVDAGGWFPTRSGSDGLAEAVRRFDGGLLVLSDSVRRPSVAERIRGMTLDSLERIGVPVVVAG